MQIAKLTQVGMSIAVIIPAAPGFYHRPAKVEELVDFIVQRVLDQLGVDAAIGKRWEG